MISEETRKKMSESAKKRSARGILPDNKGRIGCSRGLTAEDPRIKKRAETQRGQKRTGNYKKGHTRWIGEKNPRYGTSRSGDKSPRYNPLLRNRDYITYYNKVAKLTELTYEMAKDIINPENLPRTVCGVEGGYQLDHIFPIIEGYKSGKSPEEISDMMNLQMLPWKENRSKSNSTELESWI